MDCEEDHEHDPCDGCDACLTDSGECEQGCTCERCRAAAAENAADHLAD